MYETEIFAALPTFLPRKLAIARRNEMCAAEGLYGKDQNVDRK